MAQDDRVSKFVTAITREAEEQRQRIEQETKDFIASEMEKAEMEALNDSYKMIQRAVSNIRADVGSQLSSRMMENRRALLARREEILEEVLGKAGERLAAFTQTADYAAFLTASAKKALAVLRTEKPTVYLRPADMSRQAEIAAAIGPCRFEEDAGIRLGGLRMTDEAGKIAVDDTLDTRLAAQRTWFQQNSGLVLS
ncbi:MAG TPA: V-type ATP synthase subunit E [Firmicutes bacterium]|nr:V-type ATP synthase subunit E [Bacillota bacterium]